MSWIAYDPSHPFPIQNLPYGVFKSRPDGPAHPCVAIGDRVVDLAVLGERKVFSEPVNQSLQQPVLNAYMELGPAHWKETRQKLTAILSEGGDPTLRDDKELQDQCLHDISQVEMVMPAQVGDYTDFFSSREHATNCGKIFRPGGQALQPNYLHIPVGYHGRASSVVVSGKDVRRPCGQMRPADDQPPVYGSCKILDYEIEMGFFIGTGNDLGSPIPIQEAEEHIFGLTLFNDWSARDIQKWEYVPLGPFLGKSFMSTISPWVIPMEALEPFRVQGPAQEDPPPLKYLQDPRPGAFDINITAHLQPEDGTEAFCLATTNHKYLYWNMRQQVAHHTVNGCNLRPGDLMASGTISGPEEANYGSMLERTWRGTRPITLANGQERKFLQDGDTLTMDAYCQGEGYRIGFGKVSGKVLPAIPQE